MKHNRYFPTFFAHLLFAVYVISAIVSWNILFIVLGANNMDVAVSNLGGEMMGMGGNNMASLGSVARVLGNMDGMGGLGRDANVK